ncbi:MAG: anti-phage defense ZorAB system ZorA [Oceanospirillaceae bacterium]|nr:anti-phage defense ZorAB system ZorA [Oceanospirillaceae bacterium]
MFELLSHLLPQFSSVSEPGFQTMELGVWFWILMVSIMVLSVCSVIYHRGRFSRRLSRVLQLIEGQDRATLAQNRKATLDKALEQDPKVTGALWREFDESLVYSADKTRLSNTLDAEHFFNSNTLANGLTSSRLLAAAPSFLTAIGVLGTFIGLTLGLKGLQIDAEQIDTLKSGVSAMINGAAVAFMTSVWGVGLSLLLNMFEKLVERGALSKIRDLQQKIDFLYPRLPAEHSLVQIAAATEESKESLQELHERIGNSLQKAVSGMSDSMQQAFTDALNNVMAPAIKTLVDNTSQQSTDALEKLVTKFMSGMESVGRDQGSLMQGAANDVRSSLTEMGGQMEALFKRLEEQQNRSRESTEDTAQAYARMLEQQRMDATQRQEQMEQKFNQLMEQFSSKVSAQFDNAEAIDEKRTQAHEKLFELFEEQQAASREQTNKTSQEFARQIEQQGLSASKHQQAMEQRFNQLMEQMSIKATSQFDKAAELEQQRALAQKESHQQMLSGFNHQLEQFGSTTADQIKVMREAGIEQQSQLSKTFESALGDINNLLSRQTEAAAERDNQIESRFRSQVDQLASEQQKLLAAVTEGTQQAQKQMLQMAEQHRQLMAELGVVSRSVESSSQNMNRSSTQLGLLSTNLKQVTDVLDTRLQAVTSSIEGVSDQTKALAEQVTEQANTLQQLQYALSQATEHFERAAQSADQGFQAFGKHQQGFLEGIKHEFQTLGGALKHQVEEIEQQADQWLRSYSNEVRTQVSERMEQWNETTLQFADQMRSTVNVISGIVDDLEQKQ